MATYWSWVVFGMFVIGGGVVEGTDTVTRIFSVSIEVVKI